MLHTVDLTGMPCDQDAQTPWPKSLGDGPCDCLACALGCSVPSSVCIADFSNPCPFYYPLPDYMQDWSKLLHSEGAVVIRPAWHNVTLSQ